MTEDLDTSGRATLRGIWKRCSGRIELLLTCGWKKRGISIEQRKPELQLGSLFSYVQSSSEGLQQLGTSRGTARAPLFVTTLDYRRVREV